MTTKSNGTVKKWAVIALFTVAAILSAVFMGKVAINYNLADYLGKDTETKTALDIIDDEFGMTGSLQVMISGIPGETAEEICGTLEAVPNVLHVNFDRYDEAYYRDGNALFIVVIDGDDYSDAAKQVTEDIRSALASYDNTEYGGTTVEKQSLQDAITSEMGYILAISLCLVVAILLITSESWLEPFVLLAASGVAVLINRGTNVFFGEISYITNSIAAILQLALSVDYSIVLLHAYRREKEERPTCEGAMKAAILSVVKPVSASALTTIAGLLALLFMSFRIGFDIGIVLMKGIVISAITSLTLLPALILLCDRAMKKAKKKAFTPRGPLFCKIARKAGKVIVPVALALVVVCGVLQTGNHFLFTDTKAGNAAISDVFGNNNSVVVIYPNTNDGYDKEETLADALVAYRREDGKPVLSSYTAYTNTVRESYTVEKAVQKLEISEEDTELLFTMYHLYRDPASETMTFADLIGYADRLAETDADAQAFIDGDTVKTLKTLLLLDDIMQGSQTADELYTRLTTGVMEGTDLRLFAVRQLYGLYFYDDVSKKDIDFKTVLRMMLAAADNDDTKALFDADTVSDLRSLDDGIRTFEAQMDTSMDKTALRGYFLQNYGVMLSDEQLTQIYAGYFASTGEAVSDTIPFLPLMKFLVTAGQITDENAMATIGKYDALYTLTHASYEYTQYPDAFAQVASALSGGATETALSADMVQQLYIMYFYQTGTMPTGAIGGRAFTEFALATDAKNQVVHQQLTDENRNKLCDMQTVDRYMSRTEALTYPAASETLSALGDEIRSDMTASLPDTDKVAGVYIKRAVGEGQAMTSPMMAYELLDFVSGNIETNSLLREKMSEENRRKVADAQEDIASARELFIGERYSRMLLSVDLPNESEETTAFIEYLSGKVTEIFGEDAHIAGEIVSTYDLQKSFDHDNTFITVFTLVSIFIIVMLIFRSLSLPVLLVAVIQGAIFIAMSTQLAGDGVFFMSYIVSTCILMGATIDYGILMSSNYVAYRATYDREEALSLSVGAAMPTVFSSGLILTVCGFVIHFISSQNSISTVGLLIGIGTLCSVGMITVVLPSVLYLLDGFILRLSLKKKTKQ